MDNNTGEKDPTLWAIARKRAGFKRDLATYIVVNIFLWIIWLLTDTKKGHLVPWPVWVTVGWGFGILLQYFNVYRYPKENAAEREYEKLKRQS